MAKFPPNKYQVDIIDWVQNGTGNAIVDAKAGSGKTSTLELIAQNYPRKMLFIAFNKHIADEINNRSELQKYLTKKNEGGLGTLKVYTVNSIGDMTIRNDLQARGLYKGGDNKFLKENKLFSILEREIRSMCQTRHERVTDDMVWDMMKDLKRACDKVRSKYVTHDRDYAEKIIEEDNLCRFYDIERDDGLSYPILPWGQIVEDAVEEGMQLYEEKGIYDFIDQLYIPVINKLLLPSWMAYYSEFIGCDESQDLSALQLRFLKKLIKMEPQYGKKLPTRFLFVSDAFQAIYGFAGADCHSVENIRRQFSTIDLPLNICYRCARKIVEVAQQWVPTIEAAPNAKEGEVHVINNSEIADYAQPQDMVIARKNKDLAEVFLSLVLKGKPVYIKDKEMIDGAIKSIRSLGCTTVAGLQNKIDELHEEYKKTMKNPENQRQCSAINNGTMDVYDMIKAILNFYINEKKYPTTTVVEKFIEFIEELFVTEPSDNAVIVSSIHQVKGLEANRVFIINYNLMPYTSKNKTADDNQQERNLIYIAITRAKEVLYCCMGEMDDDEKSYYTKMTSEEVDNATSTYDSEYYDEIFEDDE
jgi:superfamily I DNA/RNA helicase